MWSLERALLKVEPVGYLTIDRHAALTTLFLPNQPSAEALIHPHLGSTGVVVSNWLGRTPFHSGAFIVNGRAWGVLGNREMGKSSTLMWLHQSGVPILTDDVLVLDGALAYAGPRCLDLRISAAEHFESGYYLGVVGTRERWRVQLAQTPPTVPFAGWVLLNWSDEIHLAAVSPSDRLTALAAHRALRAPDADMTGLLDLLAYPMLTFGRPRDWTEMSKAMEQLLDRVDSLS
jgi:hypothetical protein